MNITGFTRRSFATLGLAAALGACSVIPKGAEPPRGPIETAPTATPTPAPSPSDIPTDSDRHRIALLVPLTGSNAAVGQSISNATTLAILDTNADNLRITTYDTAGDARQAARQAVLDGNKLILGPMLGSNVDAVLSEARPVDVPIVSFSNDTAVASPDAFVMGHVPEQGIARTVRYAQSQGANNFAVLVPDGEYGERVEAAMRTTVPGLGGRLVATERFARGNTSITSAAQRLAERGVYDAVVIAEGPRLAGLGATALKANGDNPRIIGTELWSGDRAVLRAEALQGSLFSAVSDDRYRGFVNAYEARFGSQPYRIATLGYDAVLLTLRIAQDWQFGRDFPVDRLRSEVGFIGLDGPFRFQPNGVVERAFEVRQVRGDQVLVVDKAPTAF